jgi:hypothetical protein
MSSWEEDRTIQTFKNRSSTSCRQCSKRKLDSRKERCLGKWQYCNGDRWELTFAKCWHLYWDWLYLPLLLTLDQLVSLLSMEKQCIFQSHIWWMFLWSHLECSTSFLTSQTVISGIYTNSEKKQMRRLVVSGVRIKAIPWLVMKAVECWVEAVIYLNIHAEMLIELCLTSKNMKDLKTCQWINIWQAHLTKY